MSVAVEHESLGSWEEQCMSGAGRGAWHAGSHTNLFLFLLSCSLTARTLLWPGHQGPICSGKRRAGWFSSGLFAVLRFACQGLLLQSPTTPWPPSPLSHSVWGSIRGQVSSLACWEESLHKNCGSAARGWVSPGPGPLSTLSE